MQSLMRSNINGFTTSTGGGGAARPSSCDLLARFCPRRGDLDILDVGCGDGLFFPELERFGRVRGIEVDEGLLDPEGPFRGRIHTRPLGDPAYRGDDWRFDLITALDVVEHIADDRAAVSEMSGCSAPGA